VGCYSTLCGYPFAASDEAKYLSSYLVVLRHTNASAGYVTAFNKVVAFTDYCVPLRWVNSSVGYFATSNEAKYFTGYFLTLHGVNPFLGRLAIFDEAKYFISCPVPLCVGYPSAFVDVKCQSVVARARVTDNVAQARVIMYLAQARVNKLALARVNKLALARVNKQAQAWVNKLAQVRVIMLLAYARMIQCFSHLYIADLTWSRVTEYLVNKCVNQDENQFITSPF
jgi:hypothetical protein